MSSFKARFDGLGNSGSSLPEQWTFCNSKGNKLRKYKILANFSQTCVLNAVYWLVTLVLNLFSYPFIIQDCSQRGGAGGIVLPRMGRNLGKSDTKTGKIRGKWEGKGKIGKKMGSLPLRTGRAGYYYPAIIFHRISILMPLLLIENSEIHSVFIPCTKQSI